MTQTSLTGLPCTSMTALRAVHVRKARDWRHHVALALKQTPSGHSMPGTPAEAGECVKALMKMRFAPCT